MATHSRFTLSDREEFALTVALQLVLVGVVVFGFVTGTPRIAVNAVAALVISMLPAIIRREWHLRIDVGLMLWLTAATVLHAVGVTGPYRNIFWWDYLTHALSASFFVGIAYAVVVAQERYHDAVSFPEPFRSAYLFLVAVAMGVLWEILEFVLTQLSKLTGGKSALIVFGVSDIVTDLLFTVLGGVLVVLWGRGYFRDLSAKLTRFFAE